MPFVSHGVDILMKWKQKYSKQLIYEQAGPTKVTIVTLSKDIDQNLKKYENKTKVTSF